jgi:hypothetical protein
MFRLDRYWSQNWLLSRCFSIGDRYVCVSMCKYDLSGLHELLYLVGLIWFLAFLAGLILICLGYSGGCWVFGGILGKWGLRLVLHWGLIEDIITSNGQERYPRDRSTPKDGSTPAWLLMWINVFDALASRPKDINRAGADLANPAVPYLLVLIWRVSCR